MLALLALLLLLSANASLTGKDAGEEIVMTPLEAAVRFNHADIAHLLLAAKANPDGAEASHRSPLSWARLNSSDSLVKLLLWYNASPDYYARIPSEHKVAKDGPVPPLFAATIAGSSRIVLGEIAAGAADVHTPRRTSLVCKLTPKKRNTAR